MADVMKSRIMIEDLDGNQESRDLIVDDISFTSTNSAKAFHPLTLKIVSTVMGTPGLGMGDYLLPAVYMDFGQIQEQFNLTCLTPEGYTHVEMVDYLMQLRHWIMRNRLRSDLTFYLQLYYAGTVHMHPNNLPLMIGSSGSGVRGIVTGGPSWATFKGGDGVVKFTITFGVGYVLP